jgi:hypothetical protein
MGVNTVCFDGLSRLEADYFAIIFRPLEVSLETIDLVDNFETAFFYTIEVFCF